VKAEDLMAKAVRPPNLPRRCWTGKTPTAPATGPAAAVVILSLKLKAACAALGMLRTSMGHRRRHARLKGNIRNESQPVSDCCDDLSAAIGAPATHSSCPSFRSPTVTFIWGFA
jgi:hypothetical protein